jgi:hypothetical protein
MTMETKIPSQSDKLARLLLALSIIWLALAGPSFATLTPNNQQLPPDCTELYGCSSWCRQQDCGCTPPTGMRVCSSSCNCDSSGDIRTCTFC